MITGVAGTLEAKGPDWVQVRVGGGITIQVHVPSSSVADLGAMGEQVHLHTRLYVKDDEPVMYGFTTPQALRLFQMLNGVAGIGPRTSLALLSSLGAGPLVSAIVSEDVTALSRAPGVGRRSAGRLVLELKGKLADMAADEVSLPGLGLDGDAVSALMALGYTATESRQAVESLEGAAGLPLEEKVRRALQQLAR